MDATSGVEILNYAVFSLYLNIIYSTSDSFYFLLPLLRTYFHVETYGFYFLIHETDLKKGDERQPNYPQFYLVSFFLRELLIFTVQSIIIVSITS